MTKSKTMTGLRLVIVQRVITPYRYEPLEKLAPHPKSIRIVSSYDEIGGAAKAADISSRETNVTVCWLNSIRLS